MSKNYEKAVELLKTFTSVEDYNSKRASVKGKLSIQELALIDASGIIVKAIKENNERKG